MCWNIIPRTWESNGKEDLQDSTSPFIYKGQKWFPNGATRGFLVSLLVIMVGFEHQIHQTFPDRSQLSLQDVWETLPHSADLTSYSS